MDFDNTNCNYCTECYKKAINSVIKRQKKRKEHGLCVQCGNPLDCHSITYCSKHLEKNRQNERVKDGSSIYDVFKGCEIVEEKRIL